MISFSLSMEQKFIDLIKHTVSLDEGSYEATGGIIRSGQLFVLGAHGPWCVTFEGDFQ